MHYNLKWAGGEKEIFIEFLPKETGLNSMLALRTVRPTSFPFKGEKKNQWVTTRAKSAWVSWVWSTGHSYLAIITLIKPLCDVSTHLIKIKWLPGVPAVKTLPVLWNAIKWTSFIYLCGSFFGFVLGWLHANWTAGHGIGAADMMSSPSA